VSDRSTRIRNLGVAAALALVAALLTMMVVSRANGGTKKQQVVPTVSVLVATRDLAVGTSAAQALATGAIAPKQVPGEEIAPAAVARGSQLRGLTIVQPIYRGEQITMKRFGPSGTQGLRTELRGAARVMQVPGDANQLLAGTLHPGDHVDVIGAVKVGQNQTPYTSVVIRNVLVLTAPAAPARSAGIASGTAPLAATIKVTDRQAQRLFYVMQNGTWSFALRPATHSSNSTLQPDSASSVLQGR
jgi:Flp pilus assembly protein CpaB